MQKKLCLSKEHAKRVFTITGDEVGEDAFDLIEAKEVLFISSGEDWVPPGAAVTPPVAAVAQAEAPGHAGAPNAGPALPPRPASVEDRCVRPPASAFVEDRHESPSMQRPNACGSGGRKDLTALSVASDVQKSPSCMRSSSFKNLAALDGAAPIKRVGSRLALEMQNASDIHDSPKGMRSGGGNGGRPSANLRPPEELDTNMGCSRPPPLPRSRASD